MIWNLRDGKFNLCVSKCFDECSVFTFILGFSFFKLNFCLQHHSARYLRLVTPNWIDVDLQIDNSVLR